MQITQVWLHQTMRSLMRIVRCLYLCLDMILKGRRFPDKAQFNKEIFHCRGAFAFLSLARQAFSLFCTQSLSISRFCFALPESNSLPVLPPACLWSTWLFWCLFFFFFSVIEVSKYLHVVGIYFRNVYTQCKLKRVLHRWDENLKNVIWEVIYLGGFSICLMLSCLKIL